MKARSACRRDHHRSFSTTSSRERFASSRPRRLLLEPLEERALLSAAGPDPTALAAFVADRFEANQTLTEAADIGVGPGVHLSQLSIHEAGDEDWYRFEVLRDNSLDVALDFEAALGELTFEVTDTSGTVLETGTSTPEGATASLNSLTAGTY